MRSTALRLPTLLIIGLATLAAPHSHADAPAQSELATLTQSAIVLQKDLLATREKLLPQTEQLGLTLYLDTRNVSINESLELDIALDNQIIIKHSIEAKRGIEKIYNGALPAGEHQINAQLRIGRKTISKKLELEKTIGQDIIKITLGQGYNPSISFNHQLRAIGN